MNNAEVQRPYGRGMRKVNQRLPKKIIVEISGIRSLSTQQTIIMAAGTSAGQPVVGSDAPRQKGEATPNTLKIGCIALVEKDGQPRRAEILSIKETKSGKQFYCNFDNFNKRLDEWVSFTRIDFSQDVEWPNPDKDKSKDSKTKKTPSQTKKGPVTKKGQKRPGKKEQLADAEATVSHPWTGMAEVFLKTLVRLDRQLTRTHRFRAIARSTSDAIGKPRK